MIPTFPQELIDAIIKELTSDTETLSACNLSSKSFRRSARPQLFRKVSISVRNCQALTVFRRWTVDAREWDFDSIVPFIREFTLDFQELHDDEHQRGIFNETARIDNRTLIEILFQMANPKVSRMTSLCVANLHVSSRQWSSFDRAFIYAWQQLLCHPLLRSLCLVRVAWLPLHFDLDLGISIQHLVVQEDPILDLSRPPLQRVDDRRKPSTVAGRQRGYNLESLSIDSLSQLLGLQKLESAESRQAWRYKELRVRVKFLELFSLFDENTWNSSPNALADIISLRLDMWDFSKAARVDVDIDTLVGFHNLQALEIVTSNKADRNLDILKPFCTYILGRTVQFGCLREFKTRV
ncbi:unnamed protein product [Cyclocybe aegerita]|uniref:Uncharacterized protein n=1 Tax=Cyclocybe aegerita TaxID=1973307 RepID=A0A8S0W8C0_CYCAE|nr:unnamed protein product [Cyclocybe aegerita]